MRGRKVWQWSGSRSSEKSAWCDVENYEIGKRSESSSNVKVFLLFFFQLFLSVAQRRLLLSQIQTTTTIACVRTEVKKKNTREKYRHSATAADSIFFFISFSLSPSYSLIDSDITTAGLAVLFFFPDHPQSLSSSNLNCLLFSSAALAPSRAHTPSSFLASFTLARALLVCFSVLFRFSLVFLVQARIRRGSSRDEGSKVLRTDSLTTLCYRVDFDFNFPSLSANSPKLSKFVSSRFVLVFVSEISSENCI